MLTRSSAHQLAVMTALLAAAAAWPALSLAAQEAAPDRTATSAPADQESRPSPQPPLPPQPAPDAPRAITLTSDLVGGLGPSNAGEQADPTGLASRLLDLSPEQRAQLSRLAIQQGEERTALLTRLNDTYAEKVRALLNDEQRAVYNGALSVLNAFADETAAARKEFALSVQAAVPGASVPPDLRIVTADPAELAGLSLEKRRGLQRLREFLNKALHDALQQRLNRQAMTDPAAWQEHHRQFREAQQKAQADFEAQRAALLSPEERARLDKVEAAVSKYSDRVRQARHDAAAGLLKVLGVPAVE